MALTREQLEALYRESVAKVGQAPHPGAPVQQGMDNLSFFENYSKQMGLDSAPQKGWGIGSALKSGYANIAQGKADVALMDAKVAEAKGDFVTADNLKKRAAELAAQAQSQMPEAYKDPEGVSRFAHDVVQSVPFSGKSMLINTLARAGGSLAARGASALAGAAMGSAVGPVGTAAGGLVGALIPGLAALYTSNEESSQNKADAFNALIAKGVDPIQAEREAFWKTYIPSMAVTAPLDFLTGGLWTSGKKIMSEAGEQVTKRAAQEMIENVTKRELYQKIAGSKIAQELAKTQILPTMGKVGASALSEAVEEGTQTAAQQWGGRDPFNIGDILYSGAVGGASGGIMGGLSNVLPNRQAPKAEPEAVDPNAPTVEAIPQEQTTPAQGAPIQGQPAAEAAKSYTFDDIADLSANINSERAKLSNIIQGFNEQTSPEEKAEALAMQKNLDIAANRVNKLKGRDVSQKKIDAEMPIAQKAFSTALSVNTVRGMNDPNDITTTVSDEGTETLSATQPATTTPITGATVDAVGSKANSKGRTKGNAGIPATETKTQTPADLLTGALGTDAKSSAIPAEETTEPTTTETTGPTQAEMEKTMPVKATIETEEELDSLINGEEFNQYKEYLEEKHETIPHKLTQEENIALGKIKKATKFIVESREAEAAGDKAGARNKKAEALKALNTVSKRKIDAAQGPMDSMGNAAQSWTADENKIPDSVAHLYPGKKVGTIDNKSEIERETDLLKEKSRRIAFLKSKGASREFLNAAETDLYLEALKTRDELMAKTNKGEALTVIEQRNLITANEDIYSIKKARGDQGSIKTDVDRRKELAELRKTERKRIARIKELKAEHGKAKFKPQNNAYDIVENSPFDTSLFNNPEYQKYKEKKSRPEEFPEFKSVYDKNGTTEERQKLAEDMSGYLKQNLGARLSSLRGVFKGTGGDGNNVNTLIEEATNELSVVKGTFSLAQLNAALSQYKQNHTGELNTEQQKAINGFLSAYSNKNVSTVLKEYTGVIKSMAKDAPKVDKVKAEVEDAGDVRKLGEQIREDEKVQADKKSKEDKEKDYTLKGTTGAKRLSELEGQEGGIRRAITRLDAKELVELTEDEKRVRASLKSFISKYDNAKTDKDRQNAANSFPNDIALNKISKMAKGYKGVTKGILERLTASEDSLKEDLRMDTPERAAKVREIFGDHVADLKDPKARYMRVRRIQAEYAKHNPQALAPMEAEALGFFRDEFDKIDEANRIRSALAKEDSALNERLDLMVQSTSGKPKTVLEALEYIAELQGILQGKVNAGKSAVSRIGMAKHEKVEVSKEDRKAVKDGERAQEGLSALIDTRKVLDNKRESPERKLTVASRFIQTYGFNPEWLSPHKDAPMKKGPTKTVSPVTVGDLRIEAVGNEILTADNFSEKKDALLADVNDLLARFENDVSPWEDEAVDRAVKSLRVFRQSIVNGDAEAVIKMMDSDEMGYNIGWTTTSMEGGGSDARRQQAQSGGRPVLDNNAEISGTFKLLPLSQEALSEYELAHKGLIEKLKPSGQKRTAQPDKVIRYTKAELADQGNIAKLKADLKGLAKRAGAAIKGTVNPDERKALVSYQTRVNTVLKAINNSVFTDEGRANVVIELLGESPTKIGNWEIEGIDYTKKSGDPILSVTKASADTGITSEKFNLTRDNVQKLFGKNSKVFTNNNGGFTVKTANGNKVVINTEGIIEISRKAIEQSWGKKTLQSIDSGNAKVLGLFNKGNYGVSVISLLEGEASNFTANHEVFHFAVATAMSEKQWQTLKSAFKKAGMTDAQVEEVICDNYAKFKEGRIETAPKIRQIYNRVVDFFDTLRSMVTGNQSARQIFRDVESGNIYNQKGDNLGINNTELASIEEVKEKKDRAPETVVDRTKPKGFGESLKEVFKEKGKRGVASKIKDAIIHDLFDDTIYLKTHFGEHVYHAYEKSIAGVQGKIDRVLLYGDAERGIKGFKEILADIKEEFAKDFDNALAWTRFRDIATSRAEARDMAHTLTELAKAERANARRIRRDYLGDKRGVFSTDELQSYNKAARGSELAAKEYTKEAARYRAISNTRRTQAHASEYDAALNKLLAEHPEWEQKIKDVQKIARDQLDRLLEAGVISQESYDKMVDANPNYVPIARDIDNKLGIDAYFKRVSEGVLDITDPTKKYKGGNEHFVSPVEQIIYNESKIQRLVARQQVATQIAKEIDSGSISEEIARKAEEKDLLGKGETEFYIYKDGKRERYIIEKEVAELVNAFDAVKQKDSRALELLKVPAKILRGTVVRSPSFIAPNMLRDSMMSAILNPHVRPFVDTVKGAFVVIGKDKNADYAKKYDDWMKHGGQQSATWGSVDENSRDYKDFYEKSKKGTLNSKTTIQKLWAWLGSMAEMSEEATRVGSYMRMVEMGIDPDEAGFKTIDQMWFKRGGRSSKVINQYVPFFNAALQGSYSLAKNMFPNGKLDAKVLGKGLMYVTIPSMLITAWNLDDEERKEKYLKIPQWKKNAAWCIVLDDDIVTIPKPHAAGVFLGSLAERFMDFLEADDKRAFKNFHRALFDSVLPEATPMFFRIPYELASNYSSYYGRPIVPASELQYSPLEQSGPYTSDTARWMAQAIYKGTNPFMNMIGESGVEVSPRKIEYFSNAVFGNLGREITKGFDAVVRSVEGKELPTTNWYEKTPMTARFLANPDKMRRTEQDFREELDSALGDLNSALVNAKNTPRGSLSSRERALIGSKSSLQEMQTKELRAVSALQREIKEITKDSRMSGDRKRQLIDIRNQKIDTISKQALRKLDRIMSRVS